MATSKRDRDRVFERDGGMCAACGTTYGLSLQHRANRGAGGSKKAECFSNYLTLCWEHNARLEGDALFAAKGRAYGWKCRRNVLMTPAEQPVWYVYERAWFHLEVDGTRLRLPEWRQEELTIAAQDQLKAVA